MTATLIDGKQLARVIRDGLKERITVLRARGIVPRLDVVLIGDHPASLIYVNMKQKAAAEIGIECIIHPLDKRTTQNDALSFIQSLNRPDVHGILLQLPLPLHLDRQILLNAIEYTRDVDGLTEKNMTLRLDNDLSAVWPCTPKGCLKLIESVQPDISELKAAVIGRSNLVGQPMYELLHRKAYSVQMITKEMVQPERFTSQADIVVVAIGVPKHVKANWIKPGAIVIDVGINRIDDKIYGDVDFENVKNIARAITPVPGGVGPMTVACLLENVVEAAEKN